LDSMLDLMRRLPPTRIDGNTDLLTTICPEYADDFLGSVDQPLKLKVDKITGREYLACDYNRDGESYRSPWSNEYDPPIEDPTLPSSRMRKLEIATNDAFDSYRDMYYEGGASSAYLWELEDGGFAGVILLKKAARANSSAELSGTWDSIHVVEVAERGRQAHYKLTSTILLNLTEQFQKPREMSLSGSLTRQGEHDAPIHDSASHVINIGRIVEEMENKMRNLLQEVYFGKTRDIIFDLRSAESLIQQKMQRELQKELAGFMKRS